MKRIPPEDRAGLYVTVSIHLAVIVILLLCVVTPALKSSERFEMDFSKEDELERLEKELDRQQKLSDRLNALLEKAGVGTDPVRNVAVDKGVLKDDRGTDAEKLYREARRVQREYEEGCRYEVKQVEEKPSVTDKAADPHEEAGYTGPAVVAYHLEGRKASHLHIPAYKCLGGGEVTVFITVDPRGKVINATVYEAVSSSDPCLQRYAVEASRRSRFSDSSTASPKQVGNIVYTFIAQ